MRPRKNILFNLICFIVFTLFCFSNVAISATSKNVSPESEPETTERPKIGLVLSGGGARGFAHIGVLKVLEENNVPIDYIVGTSMGSIIGGLYAIGLTPEEIEVGVKGIAWEKVFNDFAYREYKTFRRKSEDFDFFNIHRIGITDDGLQLSPSLIEGQQIELALDRLAHPGFHINDFDNLRIPFRAVATNIENGDAFVIKEGNIARAMRASMSIPGALPPILIDNTLLVDGGIGDNIPIEVARKMGADIIIAVDVSAPLESKDDIKSSVDITAQLTTIMTRRIADRQLETLKGNDILIIPGEPEISSSDFNEYPDLIKEGERSAHEHLEAIQKLSLSYEAYSAHASSLPVVANKDPIIDFIEIENKSRLQDNVIKVRIRQKPGEPLDIPQLEEDLSYIYGLDYSGSVVYSLEQRDGKTGLIVYVRDREWAHSYLQFGLSIKSESDLGSLTNFDVAYNKHDLNSLAGEFRATAGIGSEPVLSAEIYQPLNPELDIFVAAKTGLLTTQFPVVINSEIETISRFHRVYIDLSVGKVFKQTTEFRLGMQYNDGRTENISGADSAFSQGDFNEGYYYVRLFHDSLDNLSFPNTGMFTGITYRENKQNLGADSDYKQVVMTLSGANTYDRYSFFSRLILEATINENAPYNALFRNGGFLELSGTLDRELAGQHFGLLEVAFYRRLGDITFLPIYTGFSLETGNNWNRFDDINAEDLTFAGSLFIGADTFIGPLYVAFGGNNKGDSVLYFYLGQTFLSIR
jgi:NTE family protein